MEQRGPSRYNVTLPFTRMVLRPIDYTPGAFINVKPQDSNSADRPDGADHPRQQLAMFVVYECPLQKRAIRPIAIAMPPDSISSRRSPPIGTRRGSSPATLASMWCWRGAREAIGTWAR